jgi:glycosyltransferase involved in cell wall biosynthesis
MFCSIIIPTIGRDSLTRAVRSVLEQTLTDTLFEVIVVNDSGRPLPPADWQQSNQVQILNTNQRERCVARNAGAALAKGEYLGFLDDDDWLLPDALAHFWELAQQVPDAAWLYGAIQIVDEATGACLAEVNSGLNGNCFAQIMGGAWAPIQTSLIRNRSFFEVGGYNPMIIGTEDLDLCRRIALEGDFANTQAPIACLTRGDSWHTSTDYDRAPVDVLWSRNTVLAEPQAFTRLMESADSAYWYGRIVRVYLSTIRWNWQQRQITAACSRALYTVATIFRVGQHLLSGSFWQGVKAHHVPDTLHFIVKSLEEASSTSDKSP